MNNLVFLFFNLGPTELVIVLMILLMLFGGSRLPSLAKGLGESIRLFKKGINEETDVPESKKIEDRKEDKDKAA